MFIILSSIFSCKKPVKISEIPEINYISLELKDTVDDLNNKIRRALLSFYLVDGDGDIGLNDYDTVDPYSPNSIYYYNLYINLYKKTDSTPQKLPIDFKYRIKNIQPVGINKTLKCTIKVAMSFYQPLPADTCNFEFFVFDRALHKSNVEYTGFVKVSN
ncbi:MAG: hypothetical protein N3A01_05435 [Bacteroidales bacterium]|nr:hypothetical protein [Bacteroidales bacterium]